jgi:DNA-binding NarL/FixJ family response regulator
MPGFDARLNAAVRLVDELGRVTSDGFDQLVLPALAELVGADMVTSNEVGITPGSIRYSEYPKDTLPAAAMQVWPVVAHEHPLIQHYRNTRDGRALRLSDVLSVTQLRRSALFGEFFSVLSVKHQMAVTIADVHNSTVFGMALSRTGQRDFSASDQLLLTLLRGPLVQGRLRARQRSATSIAAQRLAALTDRECQVLEMVAEGRTNVAIARKLDRSTRTVAKHLEQAYRKLGIASRAEAAAILARAR